MGTTRLSDLPEEILLIVIEELIALDGDNSLSDLSLTSRRFLQPCQRYLFAKVSKIHQSRSSDHFFTDILDRNFAISSYIRELAIVLTDHTVKPDEGWEALGYLNNVTNLTLGIRQERSMFGGLVSWYHLHTTIREKLLSLVERNPITSFDLFGFCELPMLLLQHARLLENLTVLRITVENSSATLENPPFQLKKLTFKHAPEFVETAIKTFDLSTLTNLTFEIQNFDTMNAIQRLLPLTLNLQYLCLRIESSSSRTPT